MRPIEDRPRPARALLWALVLCVAVAIAWAWLGEVDVVAVAPGRVIAVGHTKTVQAPEAAVVTTIRVADGDAVASGEVLVELDAAEPRAEHVRQLAEIARLDADAARLGALLAMANGGEAASPPALPAAARRRLAEERREYRAAFEALDAERRDVDAAVTAGAAHLAELTRSLPLVNEEAEAHRTLMSRGVVPRVRWLAVERERIAHESRLAAARAEQAGRRARRRALAARRARLAAEYGARWAGELAGVQAARAAAREAATKAARRIELATVRAPVAGRVQQLAVHTEGGVVAAGQPLLRLVPAASAIEIEVQVANRDIGFVREGQRVAVKVDTFDFIRYGVLDGRVLGISRDAVDDPRLGPYFPARVVLDADALLIDGQRLAAGPGMQVVAEFALGRRRVIDFLLGPIARRARESGRER